MEYQFIRDPISGLRIKISSEHAIIGRWLNEEIGKDKVAMVQAPVSYTHLTLPTTPYV